MDFNPLYYNNNANNWYGIDNTLTAGLTGIHKCYTIVQSGSRLFFGGKLYYDYKNIQRRPDPYYYPPPETLRFINIGYFDTTVNRMGKFANLGTPNFWLSSAFTPIGPNNPRQDSVFAMTLCGENLVAAGVFDLINTAITGFKTLIPITRSNFWQLSDTAPFNTDFSANKEIDADSFWLLYQNSNTSYISNSCFVPTFSGNVAKSNIAYYHPSNNRWIALDGTTRNITEGIFTVESVSNGSFNTLYAAGLYLSGTVLKYTGTDWVFVANTSLLSAVQIPAGVPAGTKPSMYYLYNDYVGNLIMCGSFSGFGGDWRKTGILKYNIASDTVYSMGNGFCQGPVVFSPLNIPECNGVILSGSNYIGIGNSDKRVAALNNTTGNWTTIINNTIDTSGDLNLQKLILSGSTLIMSGEFTDTLNANVKNIAKINNQVITNLDGGMGNDESDEKITGIFLYHPEAYTANTGTTLSNSPDVLFTNQSFTAGVGVGVYGNSFYVGVSGITISY